MQTFTPTSTQRPHRYDPSLFYWSWPFHLVSYEISKYSWFAFPWRLRIFNILNVFYNHSYFIFKSPLFSYTHFNWDIFFSCCQLFLSSLFILDINPHWICTCWRYFPILEPATFLKFFFVVVVGRLSVCCQSLIPEIITQKLYYFYII